MTDRDDAARLTAARALDALDLEDARRLEERLGTDPEVADELRRFEEVAALLGSVVTPEEPPAGLRASLLAAIEDLPQAAAPRHAAAALDDRAGDIVRPLAAVPAPYAEVDESVTERAVADAAGPAERRARARWFGSPGRIAAVAAAAVVLVVGGGIAGGAIVGGMGGTGGTTAATQQQDSALARISSAADVRSTSAHISSGGSATLVYSAREGRSVLVARGLAALPASKTYQLWYIDSSGARSAGTFRTNAADATTVAALSGAFSSGVTVGVTIEPGSGSKQPTTTPVVALST